VSARSAGTLPAEVVSEILAITLKLARPFDHPTVLTEIVAAARHVLDAEQGSIFIHDVETGDLVMNASADLPHRGSAGNAA
jgi:hypothetical protein